MTQPQRAAAIPTNRRLIAWLIFGGIILLIVGTIAWRLVPTLGPMGTARGFCDDLTHQRYAALYEQRLAATTRALVSEEAFIGAEQLADTQAGTVAQCDVSPLSITVTGSTAEAHVTEHRRGGITVAADLRLSGAHWLITTLPDPAIAPFAVAQQFCVAVLTQQYTNAYALLSSSITVSLTQERYVALEQYADTTNGMVTGCAIQQLALTANAASATLQVQRQHGNPAGAMVQMQLAAHNGAWQIANLPSA
jgi:hypothetical protein